MMRSGGIHTVRLTPNAKLAGFHIGSTGRVKWDGNVVNGYTDYMEQWVAIPRRAENREIRWKQAIPHHMTCKWEVSREIRDSSGGSRPILSREELD